MKTFCIVCEKNYSFLEVRFFFFLCVVEDEEDDSPSGDFGAEKKKTQLIKTKKTKRMNNIREPNNPCNDSGISPSSAGSSFFSSGGVNNDASRFGAPVDQQTIFWF